jgi:hypothetical protein
MCNWETKRQHGMRRRETKDKREVKKGKGRIKKREKTEARTEKMDKNSRMRSTK